MPADKKNALDAESFEGPESPFLELETGVRRGEPEGEAGLAALQAESAFQNTAPELGRDAYPVVIQHDVPNTSTRVVAVGQRIELDLKDVAFAENADAVTWTIPGTRVRGYDGTARDAKLVDLTNADLERPKITFYWVDAADGRIVRARFRTKSGGLGQVVHVFDVKGPTLNSFTVKTGVTRIEKRAGLTGVRFGKPIEAPGITWNWKITMPPKHAGYIKDVQTVLVDRSQILRLEPGGKEARKLVWKHPSKADQHVQLDGHSDNQAAYTTGLYESKVEAGGTSTSGRRGIEDSPHTELPPLGETVSVNDQFTYYLMFKPATDRVEESIWVPIAKAKWFWKATADQRGKNWNLRKLPRMEPSINMTTVDFPLYQSNVSDNEWQEASRASSHEQSGEAAEQEIDMFGSDRPFGEAWTGGGASAVDPFQRYPYSLSLGMTNEAFSTCAEAVERDPETKPLCGAVADLADNTEFPPFYAHNPVDMLYVASLAKIYPMYVAFELRKRVREQVKDMITLGLSTATTGWERDVFAALEKAWKPKLKAAFPFPADTPKFSEIFVLSSTGDVKFAENDPPLTNAELDVRPPHPTPGHAPISPEFKSPPGKFRDWMRLMLRWSNNEAASKCIRALGYPYINGVLGAAGFFDKTSRTGLWLSGDYLGHDWVKGDGAGQPLSPRWARLQRRTVTNFAGTAFQVARLLTLLAQERLVDKASSREMISIITGVAGIGSYIRGALAGAAPPRPFNTIASKIGCGDEVPPPGCGFTHDCAIVRVDRVGHAAKTIRYVVVALGGNPDQAKADLRKMVVNFHDCVAVRHR